MPEDKEICPATEVPIEAKLLLYALSLRGGFSRTQTMQEVRDSLSNPGESAALLPDLAKRLSLKEWRTAESQFQLAAAQQVQILSFLCDEYPPLLREIADPPLVLFCRGALPAARASGEAGTAVVGARDASDAGLRMAYEVGRILSEQGISVISGLALGIDAAAHRGALAAAGGDGFPSTIAVLGSGVALLHPRQNHELGERILRAGGGILSEFGVTLPAQKHHFPRRNRIIAGLSTRVIIVEAAHRSGSLITARLALEQGRDVLAVPGPPFSHRYAGCNELLRDGAELLLAPQDLLLTETRPTGSEETQTQVLQRQQHAASPRSTGARGLHRATARATSPRAVDAPHFRAAQHRHALAKLRLLALDNQLQPLAARIVELLSEQGFCSWEELHQRVRFPSELRVVLSLLELEGIIHQYSGGYRIGEAIDSF